MSSPIASAAAWAAKRPAVLGGSALALAAVVAVAVVATAPGPAAPAQQVMGAAPRVALTMEQMHAKAAANKAVAIVEGASFVYLTLGDWGRCGSPTTNPTTRANRCNSQLTIVPAMEAYATQTNAQLLMSVGDQFYDGPMPISGERDTAYPPSPADVVASDADPIWDESWRGIYNTPTLRTIPWKIFHGNHDYGGLLVGGQLGFGSRNVPGNDGFDNRWTAQTLNFSEVYQIPGTSDPTDCIYFIYIDTCPLMATYRSTSADLANPDRRATTGLRGIFQTQLNIISTQYDQAAWIAAEVKRATGMCKAVVMGGHHAIYSSGQHARSVRQQDLRQRLNLPAVFAWAGVDAYYNGHEHIVEVLHGNGIAGEGTVYVVTGAGSDVRVNNILVPQSEFLLEDNGFTIESVNSTHMSHSVINPNGDVVFTHTQALLPKQFQAPTALPISPPDGAVSPPVTAGGGAAWGCSLDWFSNSAMFNPATYNWCTACPEACASFLNGL